ncbi:hypothetical protein PAXRUDRAFT_821607 [Paxillus rubicundulus Ve08.2h10]|uniref:Pentacotripeptide-repeat region of PRORP domain-containing protein n=1 Tax=Paxillus rubicundulus Ve08.2h10 TaxID=930991 RepID=A0A0D0DNL3_9AGAM|nr:hypothetical protein PAXRUDRAFT_821607 [Paxillus rubicundulus Ve08.2h10]
MIEPLAAVILDGVLPRTSAARAHILKSAFAVMGGPPRRPFLRDFFTPVPQHWKAKEKASDLQTVECIQCAVSPANPMVSLCCVARHSLWCPKRNRLFMMNEVIPRRSRMSRQAGTQRCTRHSSSSAPHVSSPQTRSLNAPLSSPETHDLETEPASHLDHLRSLLRNSITFDPEQAWHAYTVSFKDNHDKSALTSTERLAFVRQLLGTLKLVDDTLPADSGLLHTWGTRLNSILRDLESSFSGDSPEFILRLCLSAQVHALLGDLVQGTQVAHQIQENPLDDSEKGALLDVYRNLLVLTRRHRGSTHVLDLIIREWNFLGPHCGNRSASKRSAMSKQSISFREAAHKILAEISNGAGLLHTRWKMDKDDRLHMGEVLLQAYCAEELHHSAHAVLLEMRTQRLPVEDLLQLKLVRAFAKADLFAIANETFLSLTRWTTPRKYNSTGLYLYARQGDVARAEQFYKMLNTNDWSTPVDQCMLMHAYAIAGRAETVVELFHEFFPRKANLPRSTSPGLLHYTTVIFAYAERSDFDGLNFWLEAMLDAGHSPDAHVYNIILQSFASRGEVGSVAAILEQMRAANIMPTRVHYTSVITLLARRKDPVAAESIYKRALHEGIAPDRRMITSLMNAHVEAGSWAGVVRVFDYLKGSGDPRLTLSIEVYNTLLKAYVLIGAPFRVVSTIFRKLQRVGVRPDAHTYALVIQSACDAGLMNIAEDVFVEMEDKAKEWEPFYRLDAFVLTIIMAGHLRLGHKAHAKTCYNDMQRRGIQPSSITFKQILQAYGNEGTEESLKIAESFLKSIMETDPSHRSWMASQSRALALENLHSPLMLVYSRQQKPEDVERLFEAMLEAGGEPSIQSLTILLDVYRRTGNVEAAHRVWPQISQLALRLSRVDELSATDSLQRQSNLLCVPLSIYIDALSAAGEHYAISDIWTKAKSQGFSFDSHNWNHLAVALVRAGELDRAFEVLEKVLIPFQRQSQAISGTRDQSPGSPLTFDPIPPDAEEPASEAPMHRKERRALAVKIATKKSGSLLDMEEQSTDFAHPLHILHRVIPSWSMWRPHAATLQVLSRVLRHLQGGRVVQAVTADEAPPTEPQYYDDQQSRAKIASDTLRRIYHKYPEAVRAVVLHERQQSRLDAITRLDDGWSR